MGRIYVNQSRLRLQLDTKTDITGALSLKIKYQKPGVVTVQEFDAESSSDTLGQIYHDFIAGELDIAGTWTFWSYVVFADGRSAPGDPIKIRVYEEGSVV